MEWPQRGQQPQGSVLGSFIFIIHINDTCLGLNNFISKFAHDTKIGSAVLSEGDMRTLQEDLRRISYWSVKWEMLFNINKCQILQIGSRNIRNDYERCGIKVKSVHLVKDLWVTVTSNLNFSQQNYQSVIKANRMMGLKGKVGGIRWCSAWPRCSTAWHWPYEPVEGRSPLPRDTDKVMGLIKRKFSCRSKDVLLLYNSFVRPHLEYAVQF